MGNTEMTQATVRKINSILRDTIDLDKLFDRDPSMFSIEKLDVFNKIELLKTDKSRFLPHIDLDSLAPEDKLEMVLRFGGKGVGRLVKFSDKELTQLPSHKYRQLVTFDFSHIRPGIFEKLSLTDKREIFMIQPSWVINNSKEKIRLTADMLFVLSTENPSFIDNYITDYSVYSIPGGFWENMINYNKKFIDIFLNNTKSCMTKTVVRDVVRTYPKVIKSLTNDIIMDSKLTCKEWIMLINSTINTKANKRMFSDWQFPDDMKETLKYDLLAESLSGKSRVTKHLQNAMSSVLKDDNDDD